MRHMSSCNVQCTSAGPLVHISGGLFPHKLKQDEVFPTQKNHSDSVHRAAFAST